MSKRGSVLGVPTLPLVPVESSSTTATWLSWFCTTNRVVPLTRMPSPAGSSAPPRSIVVVAPVAGSTRNRRPVLDWSTIRPVPSGVLPMPFTLKPSPKTRSPVSGSVSTWAW
jgi:hypothetical protein